MPSGTTLEQGDVVLLEFPFSDLSAAKQRPVLVLSRGSYNATSTDMVVCAMTSNLSSAAHSVLVDSSDMEKGRLVAESRIRADKVFTAAQSLVTKRVGRVKAGVVAQVKKEFAAIT